MPRPKNPRLDAVHQITEQIRGIEGDVYIELSEKRKLMEPLEEKRKLLLEPAYHLLVVGEGFRGAYTHDGVLVHEDTGLPRQDKTGAPPPDAVPIFGPSPERAKR